MAKAILLTQGTETIVDDDDFAWLSQYRWVAEQGWRARTFYARTTTGVKMHRLLLGLERGDKRQADHINGDGLDNRRANLRIVTLQQNTWNSRKRSSGEVTSAFKGVCWSPHHKCWRATIKANYKQYDLGHFDDEVEAALAYDIAALSLHGAYAHPNFRPGEPVPEHRTGTARGPHGKRRHTAKFNPELVRDLRRQQQAGSLNVRLFAAQHKISRFTVYKVLRGEIWKDVQ